MLPTVADDIRLAFLRLVERAPDAAVLPIGPMPSAGTYKAPSYMTEIPRQVDLERWRRGERPSNMPAERIVDTALTLDAGRLRMRSGGSIQDRGAPLVDACGRVIGIGVASARQVTADGPIRADVVPAAILARLLGRIGIQVATAVEPCAATAPPRR